MTPEEMKAREAAAKAVVDVVKSTKLSEISGATDDWFGTLGLAAIDAYLAALSPVKGPENSLQNSALSPVLDEQLDEIEKRAAGAGEDRAEFLTIAMDDVPTLLAEVRRLRALQEGFVLVAQRERERTEALLALSSHPDEETEPLRVHVAGRRTGRTSMMVDLLLARAGDRGIQVEVVETEETVTTVEELDALPRTSVILFVTPIQTAVMQKSVHDGLWYLAGSGTAVLPGWPARVLWRPTPEGSETA